MAETATAATASAGSAMLETRLLNKRFGGVVAADNINLSVGAGELRCLIGPNGAGKSTLFSLLCGIQRPDSGQILLDGRDVTELKAFERARLGVGLTFQTNRAYHALPVRENLAIPHGIGDRRHRALGAERLAFALEAFGLDPEDERPARELSHNQLQWLEIGMVLSGHPDLLLLDEPTAGMSTEETTKTAEVLKRLNETGLTIVVVEHDIAFVREVSQSVTVLHQGRIFAEGSVAEITGNELVRKIYLGKV